MTTPSGLSTSASSVQVPILRRAPAPEPGAPILTADDSPSVTVGWPAWAASVLVQRSTGRFAATFADRPTVTDRAVLDARSFTDTDVVAGQTYAYRLRHDPAKAWSAAVTVRVPGRRIDYTPPNIALPRQPPRARWQLRTFFNDNDHYDFEMSPNQAASPWAVRQVTYVPQRDGGYVGWRAGREPVQWQFGGTLRTRHQLEQLRAWVARPERVLLVTDLGEVHIVRLLTLVFQQKGGGNNPDRGTWTITCLLYDESTVPEIQSGNPLSHGKVF